MILSVCVNPALDVSATVGQIEPDVKLRTDSPVYEAGGGGVNVAKAARSLGAETRLVAALGGHTGARVAGLLGGNSGVIEVVELRSETRESVTIMARGSGRQYRFVFPGAHLDPDEAALFANTVVATAGDAAVVVLSGSLAPGVDAGLYREIIEQLGDTMVIVDTSGPALVHASRARATLLKPSVAELRGVVGRELANETEYIAAAKDLLDAGRAESVAVSLGAGGALLIDRGGSAVRVRPPAVRQVSAVGAGDSMVAAMAVELEQSGDLVAAVGTGVSAGTAAVLTPGSQLCRPEDVAALRDQVVVEHL